MSMTRFKQWQERVSARARGRQATRVEQPTWWHVLGFQDGPPPTLVNVERRFRRLATLAHPDRGGSHDRMQELNQARAEARRQLTPADLSR